MQTVQLDLLCSADSDSDGTPVASQQNGFKPTVDLKRFEQFITEEENKPVATHTSTASSKARLNTSRSPHNTKKSHTTNASNSHPPATRGHPNDKMESSVDNSLPTVTDISTIDIDTAAGADNGDTVVSDVSNGVGSVVQASLKFEDGGDHGVQNNDDALKSVLNPSPHPQHLENTQVITKLSSLLICLHAYIIVYLQYSA